MTCDSPKYDLVVFGATGFVGKLVCQYFLDCFGTQGELRWAAAGRSSAKLDKLASDLTPEAVNLPRLIADVRDESTLRALCAQTRVLISTVGPYALYGEPPVKVCVETGTDYCDLTGEVQWIRRMIQQYEALARQSGARIVHCCGFDAIPSDLGVHYLQQQAQQRFGQTCSQVKMRVKAMRGGISGGTVASAMNFAKEAVATPGLHQLLANPYSLCPESKRTSLQQPPLIDVQYDRDFQEWIAPFAMAQVNTPVVLRSQALLENAYGEDFQYSEAVLTGRGVMGWMMAQGLKVGLDSFALAASIQPTRWALEHFVVPAPGEGPSARVQAQGFYDLRFWGKTATGKNIGVKVTGDRDPGYGSTAKILGQTGVCLAKDFPKSAKEGGVWTPSTLFGDVLIERLENYAGLTFDVL